MLIYDSIKKSHLIIFGCRDAMPGVSGMMEGWKDAERSEVPPNAGNDAERSEVPPNAGEGWNDAERSEVPPNAGEGWYDAERSEVPPNAGE